MAKRVQMGCRDCKKCMISGAGRAGRKTGRGLALVMTFGLSEVAMAATKDCGQCGHPLSLHEDFQQRTGWKQNRATEGGAGTQRNQKVGPRTRSLRFRATPDELWLALLAGVNEKAIKKRDANGVKMKLGGGLSGVPAVFIDASVDTPLEGHSRLRYSVGGGMLGNASEGAAAASLNERIREEEARLVQRIESHVGPRLDGPAQSQRAEAAAGAPAVTSTGDDLASQIAKLADLNAQGILTADEFTAAKARLLG